MAFLQGIGLIVVRFVATEQADELSVFGIPDAGLLIAAGGDDVLVAGIERGAASASGIRSKSKSRKLKTSSSPSP